MNIGVCVKFERIFRYHVVISKEKSSRQELMLAKWVHVQLEYRLYLTLLSASIFQGAYQGLKRS